MAVDTMLRELLNVVWTGRFEEFGLMNIAAAEWQGDRLVVTLSIQYDDTRDETKEYWKLQCTEVVEYLLTNGFRCGLNHWKEDHPALAQYSEPFESLYFGAKSKDPDAFLGKLWAAHQEATDDWIPFDRYLNDSMRIQRLVQSKYGLLANGPSFLIEEYAKVLEQEEMRPKRLASKSGTYAPDAQMIHFGDSYVVAKAFAAEQVDPQESEKST